MPEYKVFVRFTACDDDDARSMCDTLDRHELDVHNELFRVAKGELFRESTYWCKVEEPTS